MASELAFPVYRVADLLVDTGQARVLRGEEEIALPRLSFDLLLALIEAAPRLATLDELMEKVWPGLVVSPETVSQRVSLVRAALGDDARQPRYIRGVRGRGYKLVPPVIVHDALPATAASSLPELSAATALPESRPTHWRFARHSVWTAIAMISSAAVALAVFFSLRLTPPTSAPVPERSIAVLPFESLGAAPDLDTLAQGIPEAVLHQLATVRELTVLARTSSFSIKGRKQDARDIGRKLGVRYLLDGSVQYDGRMMRVTAQLIDSATGRQLWSVRMDRAARDIFSVQDEIALEVTRALKLSLDASATDKLTGQGTSNFDAYLAYLQGRAHAATLRLTDVKVAVGEFERAVRIDPDFAAAYVDLSAAQLRVAEFDLGESRQENFQRALERGMELIERAIQLDPLNGHAYVERAYIKAFTDLAGAEADYRRGIALSPSYARAYSGLAAVLHENPEKSAETLGMLDRAIRLDPFEPQYAVAKAVFLFYRRGDADGASRLLTEVLQREPLYQPALMRLGELRWFADGEFADAIKYSEQALALDPLSEWTRRVLIRAYLDIGEPLPAQRVAEAEPALPVRMLPLELYRQDWIRAGEAAYAADDQESLVALDEPVVSAAVRMHAHVTGQYGRAIGLLERMADVSWDEQEQPHLPKRLGILTAATALAAVLSEKGEQKKSLRLARELLAHMGYAANTLQRGEFWYRGDRPILLALLGDREGSLRALQVATEHNPINPIAWFTFEADPLFESLRGDARFRKLAADMRERRGRERALLRAMREAGSVPMR